MHHHTEAGRNVQAQQPLELQHLNLLATIYKIVHPKLYPNIILSSAARHSQFYFYLVVLTVFNEVATSFWY